MSIPATNSTYGRLSEPRVAMNCDRVSGFTMLYDVIARNEYANISTTGVVSSGRIEVTEPISR